MLKRSWFLILALCLMATSTARAGEAVVPAGTLLLCTLDEPNLSSRSAEVGDPVLCNASSLREFEREIFPDGAYLAGRFEDYREPGRLLGKGWIKLEFDRLILPDTVVPIAARVIAVSHFQVDRDGKILGRGHPKRDAVGWAVPILWPMKVFTLPMRGPSPALQRESRITLKLLDDLTLAEEELREEGRTRPPQNMPFAGHQLQIVPSGRFGYGGREVPLYLGSSVPALTEDWAALRNGLGNPDPTAHVSVAAIRRDPKEDGGSPRKLTLLFLKDGLGYAVTDYWVEAGTLRYRASDGSYGMFPFSELDLDTTVRLNRERGVSFILRPPRDEH